MTFVLQKSMMNRIKHIALFVALCSAVASAQIVPNLGGQRVGISAYQFLKIGAGARGVAIGESFIAFANDGSSLYWNPAGMVQFNETQVFASHTNYVLDINHDFAGAVYHTSTSEAIGVSVISLSTKDMEQTTETQPFGTGRYFKYGDVAVGVSYARRMTDQFSFGVTVRYVSETLDMVRMNGIVTDLGTYYWTGVGSSRFAVVISNFGPDVAPSGEATMNNGTTVNTFQSFAPPTQFKFGFAMDAYKTEDHKTTVAAAWLHPNDNTESLNLGVEWDWREMFFLRAGAKRAIGQAVFGTDLTGTGDITLGMGAATPVAGLKFGFDYAYTNFGLLGSVHRISVNMGF